MDRGKDRRKCRSFFILSGESSTLPAAELKALVETYSSQTNILQYDNRLFVIEGDVDVEKISRRGAYIRAGGILLGNFQNYDIDSKDPDIGLDKIKTRFRTFAAKRYTIINNNKSYGLEEKVGRIIKKEYPETKADLKNPEILFIIVEHKEGIIIGYCNEKIQEKRWCERRARAKPFFHPSALYPKLSRALVNLARISEDEILLDPFCGTGTILIEASIMNMIPLGIDLSMKMCKGTIRNSKHFNNSLSGVINANSLKIPVNKVHGISTDIPYGRCASTLGHDTSELVRDFIEILGDILEKGRYCCLMHPSNIELKESGSIELIDEHRIYVHRNLTRVISILRKR